MKKIYVTLTLISAIGMLLFFGCSKEVEQKDTEQKKVFQPSEQDLIIEGKILAFKQKLDYVRENPNLKSGEDMTIDEGVYYIEALSNYTYGNASTPFTDYIVKSFDIILSVDNGLVNLSELQMTYDVMIETMSENYAQIPVNEKHMVVNDVSVKDTNTGSITLGITTGFGIEGTTGNNLFGPTDYWYWGWDLGKCDGSGQGVGFDATDKIERWANINIAVPIGNTYYDNVNIEEVWYYNVPTSNNPFGEYMLFYFYHDGNIPNHPCLVPDEMNYYYNALNSIGLMYKPANKSIISYNLEYDNTVGLGYWVFVHKAFIKYGIWHTSTQPPKDL
jgi:hypothetical protein